MSAVLIPAVSVVSALMGTLFVASILLKKNDIVDIFWGPGIFLVTLTAYVVAPNPNTVLELILLLTGLWAVRLAYRIYKRNHGKEEDFRYQKWRQEWGSWVYVRSFFQIYLLQGFLMLVLGASALVASAQSESFTGLSIVTIFGVLIWLIGYYFEAIGDMQLDDYIAEKKAGKTNKAVLDTGLWKYTRHPNYFGEVLMWWGIWVLVAPLPMSYIALASPVVITYLILYVSGIPMLERRFAGNPAYEAYRAKTSKFFPLPPRS
jgi:steroid 5-alpha reductase family enzyme